MQLQILVLDNSCNSLKHRSGKIITFPFLKVMFCGSLENVTSLRRHLNGHACVFPRSEFLKVWLWPWKDMWYIQAWTDFFSQVTFVYTSEFSFTVSFFLYVWSSMSLCGLFTARAWHENKHIINQSTSLYNWVPVLYPPKKWRPV